MCTAGHECRAGHSLVAAGLLLVLASETPHAQRVYEQRRDDYYRQQAVFERDYRQWLSSREQQLRRPDGLLALVDIIPLPEGSASMGSAAGMQLRLPGGPDYWGTISVRGGKVAFLAADDSGVLIGGKPKPLAALRADDRGPPTMVSAGALSFHVSRQSALALRVLDRQAAALAAFKGLEYFPPDPSWRIRAHYEPHLSGKALVLQRGGQQVSMPNPGVLRFIHDGEPRRLEALVEPGRDCLLVVFADRTNGGETFARGRYVYADYPDFGGLTMIDFNRAHNPPCAFNELIECLRPPPENRLDFAVSAGEKRYR